MKNLEELFEHQLQDLYSAEDQLTDALPKMAKKAKDANLKRAIENHLEETEEHKNRIKEICEELDFDPKGKTCKAMKGLIKETEDFMDDADDDDVLNAGMIAEAQRVEHYEISAYGTAVRYAKELGHSGIADKLQLTLDEEYNADNTLNDLAESRLNARAI